MFFKRPFLFWDKNNNNMENQNLIHQPVENNQNDVKKPKSKFWKFSVLFLAIIFIGGGGFFVWGNYLNFDAKRARQIEKQSQALLQWEKDLKEVQKNDVYGGKTPKETLQMFISALKEGDIELASKYFILNTNENSEYYLTRREWEEGLRKIKEDGKLEEIISKLEKVNLTFKDENGALFKLYNNKEIDVLVDMKFNQYSQVWKIESL